VINSPSIGGGLRSILAGEEGEDVTMDSYELRMLLHRVASKTSLYAGAVMFELLKRRER